MRVLHTSDWHLGRKLGEHALLGEQEKFCDWLVEFVSSEGIDLVAIAGDLFDRSIPPTEAVELLGSTFRSLRDAGAAVAAIAGNHDSATRLAMADGFTDAGGLYLRGGYGSAGAVTSVELGEERLQLVAVGFLDPRMAPAALRESLADRGAVPTHESVLAHALDRARESVTSGVPSLVMAHAFVTNAEPSASERDLSVGDAAMVSGGVFEGFDYVALGHLHRPQVVGGAEHLRYSGSPLAYSFSESTPKSIAIAEMSADGLSSVEQVGIPVGRRVTTVRGTLEELCCGPGNPNDWVRAELIDDLRPMDAARELRSNHPYLAQVDWVGGNAAPVGAPVLSEVKERTPQDLLFDFWTETRGEEPSAEIQSVFRDVLAESEDPDAQPGAAA